MRASTATPIASAASRSRATVGRDTAAWIASTAQTNAGYATTSVRRNDDRVIQGTVTVATATTKGRKAFSVSRRASRYAGIAAELMTYAFSTCAWWKPWRIAPWRNTGAMTSG